MGRWKSSLATRLLPLQSSTGDATVLQAPKTLPEAMVQVPQRDADGNPMGGVCLPDIVAPLGMVGLQNQPLTFTCSLVRAFQAFGRTAEAGESRPSLAERYGD